MSVIDYILSVAVLVGIVLAGVYAGSKVHNESDFITGGGKAGVIAVCGMVMGTIVGGSSTVGTAQLAYGFGFSAWWFTLGGGLGCLFLALFFVKPFRDSEKITLIEIIRSEYGDRIATTSSLLSCIGMFINVISQIIAGAALLSTIFPNLPFALILVITLLLMLFYIVFGGIVGAGIVGNIKVILLFITVGASTIAVFRQVHIGTMFNSMEPALYQNLFARGIFKDLGNGLSLILGVITTQSYMQSSLAGKDLKTARAGLLFSAVLMPLVGLGSIFVGEYMQYAHPGIEDVKTVFPQFILMYLPNGIIGIAFATLIITALGTGAGLALSIATLLEKDMITPILNRNKKDKTIDAHSELITIRIVLVVLLIVAALCGTGALGDTILDFSFLSMGLRCSVLFFPLCGALFMKGKISSKYAILAVVMGTLFTFVFGVWDVLPFSSLFVGLFAAFIMMVMGYYSKGKEIGE